MLRILNGGVDASPLLDEHRLVTLTGVRPDQYLDYAALRGDASDNLPGVPGFGPKTTARLLAALGSARAAFDDAAVGGEQCRTAVGVALAKVLATSAAREAWELNCAAMTMVDSIDLGLDLDAGVGCLPLDEPAIRLTYERFGLYSPPAVRALALRDPAPRAEVPEPAWAAPSAPRRFPKLTRPEPEPVAASSVQDVLF